MIPLRWVAKRRIEEGEVITLPLDLEGESNDVRAESWIEGQDVLDGIVGEANARVIDIPDADMDVQVALTPDIMPGEALQAMQQLLSPTAVTVPVEVPASIKTMGDFFEEGGAMAEAFARRIADEVYGVDCSRCGEPTKKPVKVGARKLCAECAPLEF
jgi:hypothetical protein